VAIGLAAMEAGALSHEGRGTESLAVVDAALQRIDDLPDGLPSITMSLVIAGGAAAVLTGNLEAAGRYAGIGYRIGEDHAGWGRALVTSGTLRAQACRLRGELADAIRLCREAIVRLRGRTVHAGPCLAELAHAYALTGDVAAARATMELAGRLVLHVGHQVEFAFRLARPWLLAAEGDVAGAVEAALGTADAARDLPGYRLFALHDVVRLGSAGLVADRLVRSAEGIDGELAPVFARHARAAREHDAGELDAVSRAFEELGLLLHAAEASAQAAAGHRRSGRVRAERAAATRAWALAARCGGARTPALAGLAAPRLTARQRQIAHLAVSGLSNREIAERLVLSTRTVANTLVHVYERTGVSGRDGLAGLLRALEPPG
jgi:ATP/maltotriose-dependent transcriptional regulator MalT